MPRWGETREGNTGRKERGREPSRGKGQECYWGARKDMGDRGGDQEMRQGREDHPEAERRQRREVRGNRSGLEGKGVMTRLLREGVRGR